MAANVFRNENGTKLLLSCEDGDVIAVVIARNGDTERIVLGFDESKWYGDIIRAVVNGAQTVFCALCDGESDTGHSIDCPCAHGNVELLREPRSQSVAEQVAEDTCAEHGKFCCAECFDMTPVGDPVRVGGGDGS